MDEVDVPVTPIGLPVPQRYAAILAVTLGTVLLLADTSVAVVALPTIARDLHVPASSAVLIVTIYQLMLAMTIVAFAALGDRMGQRRVYRSGLLVYCLAGGLCLLANNLWVLIAIRMVQALGVAAALSVTFGLIRAIYPPSHLGRGLGLNTLSSASGNALAPIAAGLVLSIASWRWIFVAGVPLALISLVAGNYLPLSERHRNSFDFTGALLSAATVGLVLLGLENVSHPSFLPFLLLGGGIVMGFILVSHQRRQHHPIVPLDLLSRPAFSLALLGSLSGVIGSTVLLVSSPFRLQHVYGFGPAETGAMIASYALASMMVAPLAGMLTDKISPRLMCFVGLGIAIIALFFAAYLPAHPHYFDVAWRIWLCGAGFGIFLAPNARLTLVAAPIHRTAVAGGLLTTARMLGQALGATMVAALLGLGLGNGPAPALTGMLLVVLAAIFSILRPDHQAPADTMDLQMVEAVPAPPEETALRPSAMKSS